VFHGCCVGAMVGVGVGVGLAVLAGAGVGGGVGIGMDAGTDGAEGFGSVRKGTKLTVPKFERFLLSDMLALIAAWSVVPHQLLVASTSMWSSVKWMFCALFTMLLFLIVASAVGPQIPATKLLAIVLY